MFRGYQNLAIKYNIYFNSILLNLSINMFAAKYINWCHRHCSMCDKNANDNTNFK